MKTINELKEGVVGLSNRMLDWIELHQPRRGSATTYVFAFGFVGLALLLRLLMAPVNAGLQYITFFPAVALAAVVGGLLPGLFATLLGAALATFFFTPPFYGFTIEAIHTSLWSNMVFLMDGIIVCSSIEAMHRYRRRTTEKVSELQAQNEHIRQLQQETERLLRRDHILMKNSTDGILIMDMQGNVVEANHAFCHMLGYPPEEMSRLNVIDWDVNWSAEELRKIFEWHIGRSSTFETVHRHKDGTLLDVEVSSFGTEIEGQHFLFSTSRDISDRKHAELVLKQHKQVIETSIDGFWMSDMKGNLLEANQAYATMFGYTVEELVNMHISQLEAIELTPEDVHAHIAKIVAQGYDRFETCYRHKDGHEIYIEVSVAHMDESQRLFAFCRDITVRKQLEEVKLRESEERFRGTLEQAAVGIVHTTMDGHFQQVNRKFCEMLGYSREELLQKSIVDISFPADMGKNMLYRQQLIAGEISSYSMEKRYVRKDGSLLWVNLTGSLLNDVNGVPKFTVGVIEDIAERKHAALMAQQYGHLLQSSFNEIYLLDADTLRFILTSEGAENNLGYSSEELDQMTPFDLTPELTPGAFEQMVFALRSGKQHILTYESKHLRKDGSAYLVDVRLQYMPSERPMFMAIIQDITERKQSEAALKQSRKLLRELVAQGEVVREEEQKRIARELHDELGQLLTALRMNIALLRIEFGENCHGLQEKLKVTTELLDQSIRCTRNVVSDLRPVAMDMGTVPAIKWLCDEFAKHGKTPCVLNSPTELSLDGALAMAAFRVVQEALTNVARYAEASKVEVTLELESGSFSITVNDNGKGFNYVEMAERKTFGLLGMHERALALGGVVNVYSAPGEGTQIFFNVPVNYDQEGGAV